ncbi:MAG TPA: DsrE/DsrF/DrsH-like family protein, partial [bacterium]|nr:DsrE/DsrF/DrsH-like family protein [bacterium]
MTIIFFSGTMDKAVAALILATTAASMGMEVTVFFTFWGLGFLKKGRKFAGKNLFQRMLEIMLPKNRNSLPLTCFNMMGMGPWMMEKLMKQTRTP